MVPQVMSRVASLSLASDAFDLLEKESTESSPLLFCAFLEMAEDGT